MQHTLKKLLILSCVLLSTTIFSYSYKENNKDVKGLTTASFEVEPTISIDPELNMSRFSPYVISAENIPETPLAVSLELWGKNGNGGGETCWDYYANGTCGSTNITKTMTKVGGSWNTPNIYPDSIYPEIYFASSQITWNNQPLSNSLRRNEYHLMHFNNPFTMVDDMTFYIEFNAYPMSTVNSADLQVYLISKNADITNFNSSWFDNANSELVATFTKDSTYHHSHNSNSSHKLVGLTTNPNGTVGTKGLDISGDFWVVLYSTSPNNARGWSLQYQPESLCTYTDRWYTGNIQGWTTTNRQGCPDSHTHIARRNSDFMDGVEVQVTATYENEQLVSEPTAFFFGELPNLPPAATSFTSPTVSGTYSDNLDISWAPATDPNNDPLQYNIYLRKDNSTVQSYLNMTTTQIIIADTTSLADGNYTLTGEVCDGVNACVPFSLGGDFTISNILPIQTISSISLNTTNTSNVFAKAGDTVTLTFNTTGTISAPIVNIYSGGDEVVGNVTSSHVSNVWTYEYVVNQNDTNGDITFTITSTTLDREYSESTNNTYVQTDTVAPSSPSSSLASGTYPSTSIHTTTITSEGSSVIRYTTTNESLSCSNGSIYTEPLNISVDTTLKSLSCDTAGNISELSTYEYLIKEDLLDISISSSNSNHLYAKAGDTVTITFESSNTITSPEVTLEANGTPLTNSIDIQETVSNIWEAKYIVSQDDHNGLISFTISSPDLYRTFDQTLDSTSISIDTVSPTQPVASPSAGLYNAAQLVSLSSLGDIFIRYTVDNSEPSCSTGLLYLYPIGILNTSTIKAVACDEAGNISSTLNSIYLISPIIVPEPEEEEETETSASESSDAEEPKVIVEENLVPVKTEEEGKTTSTQTANLDEEESSDKDIYTTNIIRRGLKVYIGELRVKIVDTEGNPIPDILVTIYSDPKEAYTDEKGIAIFKEIELREHTISLEYKERNYTKKVSLETKDTDIEEIQLEVLTVTVGDSTQSPCIYLLLIIPISIFIYIVYRNRRRKS